jgi:hypothetical protein
MYIKLRFRCYAMAEVVSHRPFPTVAQVRYRTITCEIYGVQIDNNRFFSQYLDFSPSVSVHNCFVIVFIILFLEGQAGEALEPSNEEMLFGYQESMEQKSVKRLSVSQNITSICYETRRYITVFTVLDILGLLIPLNSCKLCFLRIVLSMYSLTRTWYSKAINS